MSSLKRLGPAIFEKRCCVVALEICRHSHEDKTKNSPVNNRPMVSASELDLPGANLKNEEDEFAVPTNCCMSGCANCVWIQYAELLSEKMKTSEGDVQKIIMDKVEDPNMRAFLSMELRCRNLTKS